MLSRQVADCLLVHLRSLRRLPAEGGGANGRGSGSGRLSRLFDQLHEPRPVVGEAAHVARGGELDGRRSSALGHELLQGRVDSAVVAPDELGLIAGAGFPRPDVFWRDGEIAVYGAF